MASYIPFLGTKGRFKFKEPFNKDLNENTIYTIESIRSFANLMDTGVDVYDFIYAPYGISEDDYNKDALDGKIVVVELADEGGKYYSVPSNYILSVPNINGILYRDKMIAIDLGYLPDSYDFTELKTNMQELVKSLVGVEVDVNVLDASPTIMLTNEQSDVSTSERLSVIQNEDNIYMKYKMCNEKVAQTINIIRGLEKAIEELNDK